jgi:hypothetical protein
MADVWEDLIGTSLGKLELGIGGPFVKNDSGTVASRNAADSAYAAMHAALFATFGNDFELNTGAAGSGADWKFTFRRPSSGMTGAVVLVMPPDVAPTPNQALTVASVSSGVITLQWSTVAAGTDKLVVDTTSLVFGSTSPVTMFTLPQNAIVEWVEVIVDTAFDGSPSLSAGISGTTAKFMPSTALDLTAAAKTRFKYHPNEPADSGGTEAIIATYSAGGASVGAARILVAYVIPS